MGGRITVKYKDGLVRLKTIPFKDVIEFARYRELNNDPTKDDNSKIKDIVDLVDKYVKVYKYNNKVENVKELIDIKQVDLDTFREIVLILLAISLPDTNLTYTITCNNIIKNPNKQMLEDMKNVLDKDSPTYEKDIADIDKQIAEEPDEVACANNINRVVDYKDISEKANIKYINKPIDKKGSKLFKEVQNHKVIHKILIEEITKDHVYSDRVELLETVGLQKAETISKYVKSYHDFLLDIDQMKKDNIVIIFDFLFIASLKKGVEDMATLLKAYDYLVSKAKMKDLDYFDKNVVSQCKPEEVAIKAVCGVCDSKYDISISIDDFKLEPT